MSILYRLDIEDVNGVLAWNSKNFISLSLNINIGAKGDYQLVFSGYDTNFMDSFSEDSIVRVWRHDGIGWFNIFNGIHKTRALTYEQNSNRIFTSYGPDSHELLELAQVLYPASSSKAIKLGSASSVMIEFVRENIGLLATTSNNRYRNNSLPITIVGTPGLGATWAGEWASKNVLEALQTIREFSIQEGQHIDFEMSYLADYTWEFRAGSLYEDRTNIGLNPYTGRNAAGNVPVVFSPKYNNVKYFHVSKSRYNEANAVVALGSGVGTLRDYALAQAALLPSPIAAREMVFNVQDSEGQQLVDAARGKLRESQARPKLSFDPMLDDIKLWRDLFPGDFVTAIDLDGVEYHLQLTGVSLDISQGEGGSDTIERPNLTFTDVNLI